MDFSQSLALIAKVFIVDLMLSADNAVVIALACRSLPRRERRWIMLAGTGTAILLRILLGSFVGLIVSIPGLRMTGALALLVIAVNLIGDEEQDVTCLLSTAAGAPPSMMRVGVMALLDVVVADLVMSLDNVVALGGIAEGRIVILLFGVLLSVPLLMWGSRLIGLLIRVFPPLILWSGALLGWIGGEMIVSDPLLSDWISEQSPALAIVIPTLSALFVLLEAKIVGRDRARRALSITSQELIP